MKINKLLFFTIITLSLFLRSITGNAQESKPAATQGTSKFAAPVKTPINIKINLFALPTRNISLFAEYSFHPKMSISIGYRYMFPLQDSPIVNFAESILFGTSAFDRTTLSGFAFTPEFRFYPGGGKKYAAPHGFYIGLYARYSKYNLVIDYTDPVNNINSTSLNMSLTHTGIGLTMGKQWVLGNHFTLDWWILAFGAGVSKFSLAAQIPALVNNTAGATGFTDKFGGINVLGTGFNANVNTNTGDVSLQLSSPIITVRSILVGGLCVGWAF